MRLPFPERISIKYATIFASILYLVEQIQGTDPLYSICVFLFIIIATFAFNLAGGLARPAGAYVLFYATLGAIVGWATKAVLGEPADSNLKVPNLTAAVFLGGIVSLTFAVFVSRKLRPRKPVFANVLKEKDVPTAALGCALIGIATLYFGEIYPHKNGNLISALAQINAWIPLAIILGVRHRITATQGRSSVSLAVVAGGAAYFIILGLINFGKDGLFTPIACYLLAAASMRLRVNLWQIAGTAVVFYFLFTYMVPYSQYGRTFKSQDEDVSVAFAKNTATSADLLGDLGNVRRLYVLTMAQSKLNGEVTFFNSDQGILDRLQMIAPDDLLIEATERGKNAYGLEPMWFSALNVVPHALWPDKPEIIFGNLYAHEIGGVIDDRDFTTGVSFTPSAQAYHMAGWLGVFLVAPVVWILVFWFFDAFFGDIRDGPWSLVMVAVFSHAAPEGMLDGAIELVTHYAPGMMAAALLCGYAMPFAKSLIVRKPRPVVPARTTVGEQRAM